jgi:integrase
MDEKELPEGLQVAQLTKRAHEVIAATLPIDEEIVDAAIRGWAENTRRAFRADLELWGQWCRLKRIVPAEATGKDVAAWVRALSGVDQSNLKERRPATIKRYLVSVGWAYRMLGLPDPTQNPLVVLERKAMRRKLGERQRQAKGIRYRGDIADYDSPAMGICVEHLLQACRKDEMGDRDRVLLSIAYDSACRRSELVAIECSHIEGPDDDGAGTLFIPESKTDQDAKGEYAYLSPRTMKAIERWRDKAKIKNGPLLRRVTVHRDGSVDTIGDEKLHPNSVGLIYRRLAQRVYDRGLLGKMSKERFEKELKGISSHSIRVGVAQDNFAAEESLPAIMQSYRWKDPRTVLRYGAKLSTKSGAAARMAKRFE